MTRQTPPVQEEKLLPCPFCGPGNSMVDAYFDDLSKRWRVGCGRCGCSTGTHPKEKGPEPAIKSWNTRASAPALAQEVESQTKMVTQLKGLLHARDEELDDQETENNHLKATVTTLQQEAERLRDANSFVAEQNAMLCKELTAQKALCAELRSALETLYEDNGMIDESIDRLLQRSKRDE